MCGEQHNIKNNVTRGTAMTDIKNDTLTEQIKDTKKKYISARQALSALLNEIAQIEARKAELKNSLPDADKKWRELFRESNGKITAEMNKLRTQSVLGNDTIAEFDKLISEKKDAVKPLEWRVGDAADALINLHNRMLKQQVLSLFDNFMAENGDKLNAVMRVCYSVFCINEKNNAGASGVYENINDKETLFNDFIKDKLYSFWRGSVTKKDMGLLGNDISLYLDDEIYYDVNLKANTIQKQRYFNSKKTK